MGDAILYGGLIIESSCFQHSQKQGVSPSLLEGVLGGNISTVTTAHPLDHFDLLLCVSSGNNSSRIPLSLLLFDANLEEKGNLTTIEFPDGVVA